MTLNRLSTLSFESDNLTVKVNVVSDKTIPIVPQNEYDIPMDSEGYSYPQAPTLVGDRVETSPVNDIEGNMKRIWGIETPELSIPTNIDLDAILGTPTKTPEVLSSAEAGSISTKDLSRAEDLQKIINLDPGSKASIEYDAEGNKKSVSIVGSGNNTEFQGLGKYATPQEFMERNPEGFRLTNPGLWRKMQEEQASRTASQYGQEGTQLTSDQLRNRFVQIDQIKDFKERAIAIAQLEGDVSKAKVGFLQSAERQARSQLGIDQLTNSLQMSMKADRNHPMFLQSGGKPSIETTALASQLKQAQAAYGATVKGILAGNPLLNELDSSSKYLTKLAEKQLDKDMKAADTKEEKALILKEKREEEIQNFSNSLGAKKELVALMWPDIGGDMGAVKTRLELETKKDSKRLKEFNEAMEGGEQHAFRLALRGNEYATEIAIGKEARDKGLTREEARKQLYPYARIVGDESGLAAKEAAAAMGYPKKESKKGVSDPFNEAVMMATNPDLMKNAGLKEAATAAKIQIAERYANFKVAKDFSSDIRNWKSTAPTPQWVQAYLNDPAKNKGEPIHINTLVDEARGFPPEQRIPMMRSLRAYYMGAAEMVNKTSAYGKIDTHRAGIEFNSAAARQTFYDQVQELGGMANNISLGGFNPAGFSGLNAQIQNLLGRGQ